MTRVGGAARIALVLREGMKPLADASTERWFTAAFRANNAETMTAVTAMLVATNPTGYAGCCAAIRDMDLRRTVTLVERPTLIIGGALDPSARRRTARRWPKP